MNIRSTLSAIITASSLMVSSVVFADPAKPVILDLKDMAQKMCGAAMPQPFEAVGDGQKEACQNALSDCEKTLRTYAVETAEIKKFEKVGEYSYRTSNLEGLRFISEFEGDNVRYKMVTFDDGSGVSVPTAVYFGSDYNTFKGQIKDACEMKLIVPADLCGNGKRDTGEQCDDGADNGKPGKCPEDCRFPVMKPFNRNVPVIKGDAMMPIKKKY